MIYVIVNHWDNGQSEVLGRFATRAEAEEKVADWSRNPYGLPTRRVLAVEERDVPSGAGPRR
jgi:hypothetical protein